MESIAELSNLPGNGPARESDLREVVTSEGREERLVVRCLAGEDKAASELVREFSPMVFGIGLRLSGRPADAEDLSQEVFLRVFRALPGFRGDCGLRSWIAAIAVNASRNRIGRMVRFRQFFVVRGNDEEHRDLIESFDDPRPGPLDQFLSREATEILWTQAEELPLEYREVVVLRDHNGLTYEEIAGAVGIPVGTVRSRLSRGRTILAKRLRLILGEPGEKQ